MSQVLERARQLEWAQRKEQGAEWEGRQPRRIWAVEALKPRLTEEQFAAGHRAARECAPAFDALRCAFGADRVDGGSPGDYGMAARMTAMIRLENLRQAVSGRMAQWQTNTPARCVDWIVQLYTLPEIAAELGIYRSRGAGREREPDSRPIQPFVVSLLECMARYYDDCAPLGSGSV